MMKRILAALAAAVLFISCFTALPAKADSYTYTIQDEAVASPEAYEWERSVRAEDLGLDKIESISDVYCCNGRVFIAMSGRIVITDEEFNTIRVISEYVMDGSTVQIGTPKCVFVTEKDEIYFTEESKGMIIELDLEGNFVRAIGDPHIKSIENITYAPTKVVVDEIGRIYVKAKSVYEGIIELDPDGKFNRFIGANEVSPSILERIKRMFSTDEQIAQMALWLPTDYSDMTMDAEGYILATVRDTETRTPIRKLNAAGVDVLADYEYIESPRGDYRKNGGSTSALTNIAAAQDGRFAVIDATMSRVFVYAPDGILLYVVGGSGKRKGLFSSPVDLTFMGNRLLVADLVSCSVEVFNTTEYGDLIMSALDAQSGYDYETAAYYWQQVYDINPNSIAANMGLGKYRLRAGQYDEALKSFERTGERKSWSSAFERVRENWLEAHLGNTILIVLGAAVLIIIIKAICRRPRIAEVLNRSKTVSVLRKAKATAFTWPGYMMSSPFKAFDDMKYEDAGSTAFAFIIMLLYAWTTLLKTRYEGFLLNMNDIEHINVPLILISSVCPFLIFVVANWAVGVLIDGKGNLRNVFKFTMYSLYPVVWTNLIGMLLSRICIYEETGLVMIVYAIGWILMAFYLFIGIVTVHQFSFTKGLGDVLASAVAMAIVIFILVLFATLVSGFVNDVGTIVDEIKIYM